MPMPYPSIGSQVRTLREARAMTTREAAAATGVSRAMIGYIENDDGNVSLDKLRKLVEGLGGDLEVRVHDTRPARLRVVAGPPDLFAIVHRLTALLPSLTHHEIETLLNEIALYERDVAERNR